MAHYGKYRGTVVSNIDPLLLGRLQVSVSGISGMASSAWALPCLPPGGMSAVPEVGDSVWVEFERGDLDFPIWCGVFWTDASRVPEALRSPAPGNTLSLRTQDGAGIVIGPAGAVIEYGKGARIALSGPVGSINHGALGII